MTDSFTFLHAADLHLGSPLAALWKKDAAVAGRFAQASRDALVTLIDTALREKVAFAVIAGDIYDGDWKDVAIGHFFNREIARLARAGIPVYLLHGNHDAMNDMTRKLPLPEGVEVFPADEPGTFRIERLRVALHGQSFAVREVRQNLAAAYPAAVAGFLNIGVLHTGLTGRPEHEAYAPCGLDDLILRGYDYWALGHIHAFELVRPGDPWIVYPGNLQGRSVRECGPKGAVVVKVEHGRVAGIERIAADSARFAIADIDIGGAETMDHLAERARPALARAIGASGPALTALRIRLTGATALHRAFAANRRGIADDLQALAHHVSADAWIEKVEAATSEPRAANPALSGLDLAAALDGVVDDPALADEARRLTADVAAKLPAGFDLAELGDPQRLIAEARALALARAAEG